MSDLQNGKVLFRGNEPPPNDSDAANPEGPAIQDQEQDPNADKPITRKETMDLIEQVKNETLRQTQSLTDKMASRLDKKYQDKLDILNQGWDMLKKSGVEISEEVKANARRQALDDVLSETGTNQAAKTDALYQGGQKPNSQNAGLVDALVEKIEGKYGLQIFEDDPEAGMIDMSDPIKFLETYEVAAEKKKQRVETPAAARLTSLASGSNPTADAEAIAAELIEMQKNPQVNKEKRKELTKRLEELQK